MMIPGEMELTVAPCLDRVGYITTQFFALLKSGKPRTEREVSFYADQLHVTAKYLSDNSLSITQIADEMQFTSVSYFSRYCVKHLGMSPARYRMAKC